METSGARKKRKGGGKKDDDTKKGSGERRNPFHKGPRCDLGFDDPDGDLILQAVEAAIKVATSQRDTDPDGTSEMVIRVFDPESTTRRLPRKRRAVEGYDMWSLVELGPGVGAWRCERVGVRNVDVPNLLLLAPGRTGHPQARDARAEAVLRFSEPVDTRYVQLFLDRVYSVYQSGSASRREVQFPLQTIQSDPTAAEVGVGLFVSQFARDYFTESGSQLKIEIAAGRKVVYTSTLDVTRRF